MDTRLIDRTLSILTSVSIDRHAQSQAINKVEGMASYVMMRRLTQPPAICRCDDCPITITQLSLQGPTQHVVPHLNIIKTLLK